MLNTYREVRKDRGLNSVNKSLEGGVYKTEKISIHGLNQQFPKSIEPVVIFFLDMSVYPFVIYILGDITINEFEMCLNNYVLVDII